MTYEEFEWHILRMTYEERLERLQPAFLAYALGLPHETVTSYLEHAVHAGVLEMDVTEQGRIEYFVPGIDFASQLPTPVWKKRSRPRPRRRPPMQQMAASQAATPGLIDGPTPHGFRETFAGISKSGTQGRTARSFAPRIR